MSSTSALRTDALANDDAAVDTSHGVDVVPSSWNGGVGASRSSMLSGRPLMTLRCRLLPLRWSQLAYRDRDAERRFCR